MDELTSSFPIINNRYQIFSTIATGGMAVIYNAQDLILERKVAIKILKKELSCDQTFQNRFRSEAKASANLIHPNIITTFDFGLDRDRLYIVMEFVDGGDLKAVMEQEVDLPLEQKLDFLLQASSGLGYAHRSGFVHCDVKPQNMLISKTGNLKITDFGIARAMSTISREEKYDVVWGSPYYFSPEQASGRPPSPATDVYSLGVIAYELMSGQLPFDADDSAELARMHRTELPKPPICINPDIPDTLNQIILKALSKDPDERFHDGEKLHQELARIDLSINKSISVMQQSIDKPDKKIKSDKLKNYPLKADKNKTRLIQPTTIILAAIALIFAGGLIPFWLYVILQINTFNR